MKKQIQLIIILCALLSLPINLQAISNTTTNIGDKIDTIEYISSQTGNKAMSNNLKQVNIYTLQAGERSQMRIELLRPLSWLENHGATVGGIIHLCIAEMDIDSDAYVESITACPPVEHGEVGIVTGVYQSICNELVSITIEGSNEPIQCTTDHQFFSVSREDWFAAKDLIAGEYLQTDQGMVCISSLEFLQGEYQVYNIEVMNDHRYYVTSEHILTHNAYVEFPHPESSNALAEVRGILNELGYQFPEKEVRFSEGINCKSYIPANALTRWVNPQTKEVILLPSEAIWHQRGVGYAHRWMNAFVKIMRKRTGHDIHIASPSVAQKTVRSSTDTVDIATALQGLKARQIDAFFQQVPKVPLSRSILQLPGELIPIAHLRYNKGYTLPILSEKAGIPYHHAQKKVAIIRNLLLKDSSFTPYLDEFLKTF